MSNSRLTRSSIQRLVHAETVEATAFYLHLVPEFQTSPTDELHLFLLMKDIRRTLS